MTMFMETVKNLGNEDQVRKWMPKIQNLDILGCYGQTEIGHGSDVANLETTATFDSKTDEFVLNTPSQTATKWWPGEMGRFANHAVIFARLKIDDNDYGVAPLIVQIRDLKTHKRMPGIDCGDIGPKMGYHGKDNGWLSLTNVRVPRD